MTRAILTRLNVDKSLTLKSLELLINNEKGKSKKSNLLSIGRTALHEIVLDSQTCADYLDLKSGSFKVKYEKFDLI
jgi:hypothetical protein